MKKKTTEIVLADERMVNKIFIIRGEKVMLDRDLAELYGVPTSQLNQAVKRNIERFPKDFVFQLTKPRSGKLDITICDIQFGKDGFTQTSLRIYRTWNIDVIKCFEK
jgi:hypothetical protein